MCVLDRGKIYFLLRVTFKKNVGTELHHHLHHVRGLSDGPTRQQKLLSWVFGTASHGCMARLVHSQQQIDKSTNWKRSTKIKRYSTICMPCSCEVVHVASRALLRNGGSLPLVPIKGKKSGKVVSPLSTSLGGGGKLGLEGSGAWPASWRLTVERPVLPPLLRSTVWQ